MQTKPQSPTSESASAQNNSINRLATQNGNKKNDIWSENIHLRKTHEDPSITNKLLFNNKILNESDKFIDYIHHTEKQRRLALQSILEDI